MYELIKSKIFSNRNQVIKMIIHRTIRTANKINLTFAHEKCLHETNSNINIEIPAQYSTAQHQKDKIDGWWMES